MKVIGIIAEYNPFHNGHLYQVNEVKKRYPDSMIIIVLSGPFTQRGEISIINKYQKTEICLAYGIDLIVELPYLYATQAADYFADAAIKILNYLKIDMLVFGTESEDIKDLKAIAENQNNYNQKIKDILKTGVSYPTAISQTNNNVNTPNNLLGISYIKAINEINTNIEVVNIKRTNNYHDKSINGNVASATSIRNNITDFSLIKKTVPPKTFETLQNINIDHQLLFKLLKHQIITSDIKNIKGVEEGIENRVYKVINQCDNLEELINDIKSKRYTYARISRMLNHILLNIDKNNYEIDYIRVLGFNKNGKSYLNKIKKQLPIPLLTCYKPNVSKLLDINLKADLCYYMITNQNIDEYKVKPIIKKD